MEERPFSAVMDPDGRTLQVSGSVDELSLDEFREALHACVNTTPDPVVNLSDVDFLPSMAIGVLVGVCRPDWDSVTVVARQGCFAAKVLEVCGIPFAYRNEIPQSTVS